MSNFAAELNYILRQAATTEKNEAVDLVTAAVNRAINKYSKKEINKNLLELQLGKLPTHITSTVIIALLEHSKKLPALPTLIETCSITSPHTELKEFCTYKLAQLREPTLVQQLMAHYSPASILVAFQQFKDRFLK